MTSVFLNPKSPLCTINKFCSHQNKSFSTINKICSLQSKSFSTINKLLFHSKQILLTSKQIITSIKTFSDFEGSFHSILSTFKIMQKKNWEHIFCLSTVHFLFFAILFQIFKSLSTKFCPLSKKCKKLGSLFFACPLSTFHFLQNFSRFLEPCPLDFVHFQKRAKKIGVSFFACPLSTLHFFQNFFRFSEPCPLEFVHFQKSGENLCSFAKSAQ